MLESHTWSFASGVSKTYILPVSQILLSIPQKQHDNLSNLNKNAG
jgi:hypothetical protein